MKLSKQKLKQIIKEELKQHEFEDFMETYVVDNPLYSLDGETSKSLFAGYMQSTGRAPPDVEALQDMYDSLARNMDPSDRSHMADLMEIIKEELESLIETSEEWVLRKSGKSDAKAFLHPTPALTQKKGEYNWGSKDGARTFKGRNGEDRADHEKELLSDKGINVSVERI